MAYGLGVDVGGTFTDLVLINHATGEVFRAKVASTPADQSRAVLAGIEKICSLADISAAEIADVTHGTTVATNALLEGKGCKVGLVVTEGYRQILQVGRSYVPGGLAGWIIWPKPEPLASLEDTREVSERISARGEVVRPLDKTGVREALRRMKESKVQALAVSFINSYANPVHESLVHEIARQEGFDAPVSLSSEVMPEMGEYERTVTTVANSYVRPLVAGYLASLEREIRTRQAKAKLKILRSDGGLMAADLAGRMPVQILMSGPAGGVAAALWVAKQAGYENVLTLDMGGTSTDVALIERGRATVRREVTVSNVTVRVSSLDVRTVGAGGGSIAKVPELTKALRVGPESAGAEPGPVAYGKGGIEPTVTDANVVLGYLPTGLLGGEIKLDKAGAEAAIRKVADSLGIGVLEAASGIVAIANENMFGALRLVSIEKGYNPRDFALVAFGGAGPLHANALGALLRCWPVMVPPSPGVLCALGDATTQMRNEASRTLVRRFSETSSEEVLAALRELAEKAAAALDAEGVAREEQVVTYEVDVRYRGQGLALPVTVDAAKLVHEGLISIARNFDEVHTQLFTFALGVEHELVNLRAVVQGKPPVVKPTLLAEGSDDPSPAQVGETRVWIDHRWQTAAIYDRARLLARNRMAGPAIVCEMDSTTLILPKHSGAVDKFGNILITPSPNGDGSTGHAEGSHH